MSLSNSKKKKIKLTLKMKRCKYCHSTENLTIDHKHPLILGGTDDIKNLQCLCEYCNSVKSGIPHGTMMHLLKWAKHVFDNNEKYLKRFSKQHAI